MKITLFAKKCKTSDGRDFYRYLTTLTRPSTGEEFTAAVKFREACGNPKGAECPCIIEFNKKDANLSKHHYTDSETGEVKESYELWVSAWMFAGEYVDTSLDDIEGA